MEVILLERVAKLGQIGDVVRVKDGYARNFLLAKSKAWDGYEDAAGPIKPAMKKLVEKL